MRANSPFVLSIGGIDPSAGAGVLSDIQTFSHCGVMGLAVSTCLTFQNHQELKEIHWFELEKILGQIEPLIGHYNIESIKIALVPNWGFLNEILNYLINHFPKARIILDPVLTSSSGYEICELPNEEEQQVVMSKLFAITPNTGEFELLKLRRQEHYPCHVYHKSALPEKGADILIKQNGERQNFYPTKMGSEKHGSGCVFSASLAAYLAKGKTLETACTLAKENIEKYLTSNINLIGTLSA